MFEDFRKQTDESAFPIPEPEDNDLRDNLDINQPELHFLGMTAVQRFALATLLFLISLVLGVIFLFISGRVVLPNFG